MLMIDIQATILAPGNRNVSSGAPFSGTRVGIRPRH
jgi:hypothetical protein